MGEFGFQENELITGISILAVLEQCHKLELSKCLLIEPLLGYTSILSRLSDKRIRDLSIEEIILKEKVTLSNFNGRYYDSLILSTNAIMLFQNMNLLKQEGNMLVRTSVFFDFNNCDLGEKAAARIKVAKKLSDILKGGDPLDFYLGLRIKL